MSATRKLEVVTPAVTWDDPLRLWLADYIKRNPHHNTSVLSKRDYIGVSRPALDAYLAGTYFLPKDQGGQGVDPKGSGLEPKVRAFREQIEGSQQHQHKNFVENQTWQSFKVASETAIKYRAVVVVYGPPGTGKSRCLLEFVRKQLRTPPVAILCSRNVTPKYLARRIAGSLHIGETAHHPRPTYSDVPLAELEDVIADKLKRSPRPLFIDQANYLNEQGLGTLCQIWELAQVPIVLIGTTRLYDAFTSTPMTEDVRDQLRRRVKIFYHLPNLSNQEGLAIIRNALPEATDEECARLLSGTASIFSYLVDALDLIPGLKKDHPRWSLVKVIDAACSKVVGPE